MKVTISQLDPSQLDREWRRLQEHIASQETALLLLPEMCFSPWFCAMPTREERRWREAVRAHESWLERLPELGARIIVGTAPRDSAGKRLNVAYLWTREEGLRWIHAKTYLPNDEGYWEANWYDRAPIDFQPARIGACSIGLMICTEIWFLQHAREYGKRRVHLLLNPRSTPWQTNDKWLAGGRTAAVVSGAYCLSSNHAGQVGELRLGGAGWICDPDGVTLATTSAAEPLVTQELDLGRAEAAKNSYPRYVDDSPL